MEGEVIERQGVNQDKWKQFSAGKVKMMVKSLISS